MCVYCYIEHLIGRLIFELFTRCNINRERKLIVQILQFVFAANKLPQKKDLTKTMDAKKLNK